MTPIEFSCRETLQISREEIARRILDLSNWRDFKGYGVMPGIKSAEFEVRTEAVVGTRVRVVNTDGSSHVEEIVDWRPDCRLQLVLKEFSAPLAGLATAFDETWEFEQDAGGVKVVRSFKLYPKSQRARLALWLISFLLKPAIARHLRQMRALDACE